MRKALIVGINDYPNAPLHGCVNDAQSVSTVLGKHADGSPDFAINLLTSPPDTIDRPTLRDAIESLYQGDPDIALFYFSGHGLIKSTGGFIVTTDFKKYDEGIPMNEIFSHANRSKARERIIIMDCCHSGAFGTPSIDDQEKTSLAEGMTILTASREWENALESNDCGVFTSLVISALQGGAADLCGRITPGSVYAYVDQALGPWEQRPVFKTCVSRFTSLRSITPRVPLATLRKLREYFLEPEDQFKLDPSYEFTHKDADEAHVAILKDLQKFESVDLVVPVDAEHMYFAAIESKACRLTALGAHYWRLVNEKKI